MDFGWIKVAAGACETIVADCAANVINIIEECKKASARGVKVIVFPELCITSATCGDIFFQEALLHSALESIQNLLEETRLLDIIIVVGSPIKHQDSIYNCALTLYKGEILLVTPKYIGTRERESRQFESGQDINTVITLLSQDVLFSKNRYLVCNQMPELTLYPVFYDYFEHGLAGFNISDIANSANILLCLGAEPEKSGKQSVRENLISAHSYTSKSAVIASMAGAGESTTDNVYGGAALIADGGSIISKNKLFSGLTIISDIDVKAISGAKTKLDINNKPDISRFVNFDMNLTKNKLDRHIPKSPFISQDDELRDELSEQTLEIQARALAKRLNHVGNSRPVIGISGGQDSTLALIVAVRAMNISSRPVQDIIGINMPCFGSSDRTKKNSADLCDAYKIDYRIIDITKSVTQHFEDIGQDINNHDTTYENAQARERTQVLMDISNKENGLVVGTGNISELALGWATYNGDHMSMYAVNSGLPKTVLRSLVVYECMTTDDAKLKKVLGDILDTPISPELLPPKDGKISQSTENLIGPYELHDFFLYYALKGYSVTRIFNIACIAFKDDYKDSEIIDWMHTFFRRFFQQQFKRSVLPDGVDAIGISLSPRGYWMMPSDAHSTAWLKEIENIKAGLGD